MPRIGAVFSFFAALYIISLDIHFVKLYIVDKESGESFKILPFDRKRSAGIWQNAKYETPLILMSHTGDRSKGCREDPFPVVLWIGRNLALDGSFRKKSSESTR